MSRRRSLWLRWIGLTLPKPCHMSSIHLRVYMSVNGLICDYTLRLFVFIAVIHHLCYDIDRYIIQDITQFKYILVSYKNNRSYTFYT